MPYGPTTPSSSPCASCVNCPDQRECSFAGVARVPTIHDAASCIWVSSNDEPEPHELIARDGAITSDPYA